MNSSKRINENKESTVAKIKISRQSTLDICQSESSTSFLDNEAETQVIDNCEENDQTSIGAHEADTQWTEELPAPAEDREAGTQLTEEEVKLTQKEILMVSKETKVVPILKSNESMNLEENLVCNICQELMYNCVSINPCLHCFCAACLLEWRLNGASCPICRVSIKTVTKNHLIQNIIDKFVNKHPSKLKNQKSRNEEDQKVKEHQAVLFASDDLGTDSSTVTVAPNYANNCSICNYPDLSAPSSTLSGQANPNQLSCNSTMTHSQCQCCQRFVPDFPNSPSSPPPKRCTICNGHFCSLLFGQCPSCPHGCLHFFRDYLKNSYVNVSHDQVPMFLPDNFYETNILRNWLVAHGLSVDQMYQSALEHIDSGTISLTQGVTGQSALCLRCGKASMEEMIYQFRASAVVSGDLPSAVRARPDCHYGRHCRTQRTRQHHATNYNHVCDQTRFS